MAVTRLVQASSVSVQPVGSTGTYTLAVPLTPGLYKITTDTSQNFSTGNLYFQTQAGYRFGAVVRGGQGYVAVPETVTTVTFGTGSFPLLIGFEKFSSYSLIAAPTNLNLDFTSAASPYTFSLGFTPPSGATSIGVYWSNGTFTDLSTTTSPATGTLVGGTPSAGATFPMLVVAKDANGVWGLGASPQQVFSYYVFTASATYTPPEGSTSALVYVVGGGGAGGGSGNTQGGGGGAGEVASGTIATNGPITFTIGAGAPDSPSANSAGGDGGTTTFANLVAIGGGGGGAAGATGRTGACGGAASGVGNVGGSGGLDGGAGGGGGGGMGGNGADGGNNSINNSVASGGAGVNVFGVTVASGGSGGFTTYNGPAAGRALNPNRGGGGGGAGYWAYPNPAYASPGREGTAGAVYVKALYS